MAEDNPISVVERLEKANAEAKTILAEQKEVLKRNEELAARKLIGGEAEVNKDVKKEESPQDYAKRVISGKI